MAIDWQTRGEGRFAHRYHRLTAEQEAAVVAPDEVGVCELVIDGETVFTWALQTPALQARPVLFLPVVYATRDDAEAHGEVWATRDRDVYWSQAGGAS